MIAVATLLRAPFLWRHKETEEAGREGSPYRDVFPELGDADTLFEIAFLAAAADGSVGEEERQTLDLVAKGMGVTDVDARIQKHRDALYGSTFAERATEVARRITSKVARRAAYSLAFVMHVSDLNQAPEEDELEILLEKEWGMESEAAELKEEVMEFLNTE